MSWTFWVIARFIDIGGIVDHHCLNSLFFQEIGRNTVSCAKATRSIHDRKLLRFL
jgi:hypothetical protein